MKKTDEEARMSGELWLREQGWKALRLPLLMTAALTVLIMAAVIPFLPLEGFSRGAVISALSYILFRLLYPLMTRLTHTDATRTVYWSVTEDALTLDGKTIPRKRIRRVHVWPDRNALGQSRPGYTVNIETDGKNELLHTLTEGEQAEESAKKMLAFVEALGYAVPDNE